MFIKRITRKRVATFLISCIIYALITWLHAIPIAILSCIFFTFYLHILHIYLVSILLLVLYILQLWDAVLHWQPPIRAILLGLILLQLYKTWKIHAKFKLKIVQNNSYWTVYTICAGQSEINGPKLGDMFSINSANSQKGRQLSPYPIKAQHFGKLPVLRRQ